VSLPRSLAELTPAWLTDALRPALTGRVSDVRLADPGAGIAVTSRVGRLLLDIDGDPAFPRSIVAKVLNPAWTHGDDLHRRESSCSRI